MKEIEKPLKSNKMEENVDKWDADFINLEDSVLYQIVTASNYLMIQPLLDLAYPHLNIQISSLLIVQKSLHISRGSLPRRFASTFISRMTSQRRKKKEYSSSPLLPLDSAR